MKLYHGTNTDIEHIDFTIQKSVKILVWDFI